MPRRRRHVGYTAVEPLDDDMAQLLGLPLGVVESIEVLAACHCRWCGRIIVADRLPRSRTCGQCRHPRRRVPDAAP